MQTFWNIIGWCFLAPFLLLAAIFIGGLGLTIIVIILAIIFAISIFAIPVLLALHLLNKLV